MPDKVVRIIARLNIGGPAVHAILLTSRLPSERYASLLVTGAESPEEGNMLQLAEEEGVRPLLIPEMGRELSSLNDPLAFAKLLKLMVREQPSIVHTHTAKAGALGRLAALGINLGRALKRSFGRNCRPSVRIVHTYHGHVFSGYFSPAKTRLFLAVERALARYTDVIVAISPRQRDELVHTYRIALSEKIRTIPLGLDLAPFANCKSRKGKLREELGLKDGTRLFGVVGRLVPIKRHDLAFRALSLLKSSPVYSDICFVIVGDGELRPELERLSRQSGLSDRVRFLGWRRDLESIYADLDCLVLTSDNEGTPVSMIEAMAAGVPVLATAVGGVPDLMEPITESEVRGEVKLSSGESLGLWSGTETGRELDGPRLGASGILVPKGNVRFLSLALELLCSEPDLLKKCGGRGSLWAKEAFSIARLTSDIDLLYRELLGKERN